MDEEEFDMNEDEFDMNDFDDEGVELPSEEDDEIFGGDYGSSEEYVEGEDFVNIDEGDLDQNDIVRSMI